MAQQASIWSACRHRAIAPVAAAILFCVIGNAHAATTFADAFVDRQTLTDDNGQLDGNSTTATREPNEPRHGGQAGGRSVWISWVAPADGVATFSTDGSNFDTLLSAYYFAQPFDTTLDKLKEAARNDDASGITQASLIQFGALSGVRYEIAVDGYRGAAGDIRLRWDFVNATSPPPVIVTVPDDQAARQGDPVTLTVDMQTSPDFDLQWRLNGNSFGATGPTLVIPSLQPANVGRYTLRIRIGDVRFETTPTELQINTDGQTNALARDKFLDAVESPLLGDDGSGGGGGLRLRTKSAGGVVRGYDGSQIFNTTYATVDPTEPQHCGAATGASYWWAYQPPTNGTVVLDTIGSSFDTLVAVYTYDAPLMSYSGLIPVTCDNDSVAPLGAARVEFAAVKSRQYAVVVTGVNGARGTVYLNYRLDVTRPPVPPTLMQAPALRTAAAGSDVALSVQVQGSPPLRYLWRREEAALPNATNATLLLTNSIPAHSGDYVVTVSNLVGAPLSVTVPLRVLVTPRMQIQCLDDAAVISFPTVLGQHYTVERESALEGAWLPMAEPLPGTGSRAFVTNTFKPGAKFYRVRVE